MGFSKETKKAAWKRAGGTCECGCGMPFSDHPKEFPEYDHRIPRKSGGTDDLDNCMVLRWCCHRVKTNTVDMPVIKKIRREDKRKMGLKKKARGFSTNRDGPYKVKMDGTIVRR